MDFLINAEKREKKGTSSSRNIRRDGFVPGIIYGAGKEEQTISLRKHEVAKNLEQDAFYSQVLDISLDGKKEQVILRDIQRHPAKREILHMDFQRVKADQKINVTILRAGNIIGGGDWNENRLIPDFFKSMTYCSCPNFNPLVSICGLCLYFFAIFIISNKPSFIVGSAPINLISVLFGNFLNTSSSFVGSTSANLGLFNMSPR